MIKELKTLWYSKKIYVISYVSSELIILLLYLSNLLNNKTVGTTEVLSFSMLFFAYTMPIFIFYRENNEILSMELFLQKDFNFIVYDITIYIINILFFITLSSFIKPNILDNYTFNTFFYLIILGFFIYLTFLYINLNLLYYIFLFFCFFIFINLLYIKFFFIFYPFKYFFILFYLFIYLLPTFCFLKLHFSIFKIKFFLISLFLIIVISVNTIYILFLMYYPSGNSNNTHFYAFKDKIYFFTAINREFDIRKTLIYDIKKKKKSPLCHFSKIFYKDKDKVIYSPNIYGFKLPSIKSSIVYEDFQIFYIKSKKYKIKLKNYYPFFFKIFRDFNINDYIYFPHNRQLYKLNLQDFSLRKILKIKRSKYYIDYGIIITHYLFYDTNGNAYTIFNDMTLYKIKNPKKYTAYIKISSKIYELDYKNKILYDENGNIVCKAKKYLWISSFIVKKDGNYYFLSHGKLKKINFELFNHKLQIHHYFLKNKYIIKYIKNKKWYIYDDEGNLISKYNWKYGKPFFYKNTLYSIFYNGKIVFIYKFQNNKPILYDKFKY